MKQSLHVSYMKRILLQTAAAVILLDYSSVPVISFLSFTSVLPVLFPLSYGLAFLWKLSKLMYHLFSFYQVLTSLKSSAAIPFTNGEACSLQISYENKTIFNSSFCKELMEKDKRWKNILFTVDGWHCSCLTLVCLIATSSPGQVLALHALLNKVCMFSLRMHCFIHKTVQVWLISKGNVSAFACRRVSVCANPHEMFKLYFKCCPVKAGTGPCNKTRKNPWLNNLMNKQHFSATIHLNTTL